MRRREFVAIAAGAAVWPVCAGAQKAVPVIGYLASSSAAAPSGPVEGIHLGLRQAGYEVGRTVRMEYRYAENHTERLPELAAELVGMPVALLLTSGGPRVALVAKRATATIPIVFAPVSDPVANGLVESLNKPGGNITGVAALTVELDPKRLEYLHEVAPSGGRLGALLDPTRPDAARQLDSLNAAARTLGRELVTAAASTVDELDPAFPLLARHSISGLLVGAAPLFSSQEKKIVELVSRHRWPAVYQWREFAEKGGLLSYGPSRFDGFRQVGVFAARILNGEKPAELPVQQPTKLELVINLNTAKALALTMPPALLARADEVIE